MGQVFVGTASWTDKTLLESGWYPPDVTTPADRLRFYAERYPLVEVDSTYYTPPNERNSELWAARTPAYFRFNVKAFSLLTQHPTRVNAIYKDLRPDTTKNVYPKDLDAKVIDEVWERFLSALEPLHAFGRCRSLFNHLGRAPLACRPGPAILVARRPADLVGFRLQQPVQRLLDTRAQHLVNVPA